MMNTNLFLSNETIEERIGRGLMILPVIQG